MGAGNTKVKPASSESLDTYVSNIEQLEILMIINMLQGVSDMLKESKETEVKCAKIMLDKVIEGMKDRTEPIIIPTGKLKRHSDSIISDLPDEPQYLINVDQGKLIDIKVSTESGMQEAEPDLAIEVNGAVTTYHLAKGKPFQEGRIL